MKSGIVGGRRTPAPGLVWESDDLRIVASGDTITLEERIGPHWFPASSGHPAYKLFEAYCELARW